MSQENVDAMKAWVVALNRGLRSYLRDLDDAWEWFRVDAHEYRDLGEIVFQLGRLQAKGRSSGLEVEERFAWLHRFRKGTGPGRYLGVEFFATTDDALEAAGRSD